MDKLLIPVYFENNEPNIEIINVRFWTLCIGYISETKHFEIHVYRNFLYYFWTLFNRLLYFLIIFFNILYIFFINNFNFLLQNDWKLWTLVFCLAAIVYTSVGLFYVFCGSGEIQSWNRKQSSRKNSDDTIKQDDIIKPHVSRDLTKV